MKLCLWSHRVKSKMSLAWGGSSYNIVCKQAATKMSQSRRKRQSAILATAPPYYFQVRASAERSNAHVLYITIICDNLQVRINSTTLWRWGGTVFLASCRRGAFFEHKATVLLVNEVIPAKRFFSWNKATLWNEQIKSFTLKAGAEWRTTADRISLRCHTAQKVG